MKVSLIVAVDENLGIGANNTLIWHLPDDFKWFKEKTMGLPVIMGRKTMDSLGRALKGRMNIVISSKPELVQEPFVYASSLGDALRIAECEDLPEIMIIGGGSIYKEALECADKMYITRVQHAFENMDTFFPKWNEDEWKCSFKEMHQKDERHLYAFEFQIWERRDSTSKKNS